MTESIASISSNITRYDYSGHQLEPGWIRIFRLVSGSWDETPAGSMSAIKLEVNHRLKNNYAAISFEWGSSNQQGEVMIDGKCLKIPVGLERALRQIRHTVLENPYWHHRHSGEAQTYSMDVWADAICIDQSNEDEKKLQIQMMGSIFQHADPLYIWLGYPSQADRLAMETIKQLAAPFPVSRNTKLTNHPTEEYSQPDPESEKWAAIQGLLSKPYFNRSWASRSPPTKLPSPALSYMLILPDYTRNRPAKYERLASILRQPLGTMGRYPNRHSSSANALMATTATVRLAQYPGGAHRWNTRQVSESTNGHGRSHKPRMFSEREPVCFSRAPVSFPGGQDLVDPQHMHGSRERSFIASTRE